MLNSKSFLPESVIENHLDNFLLDESKNVYQNGSLRLRIVKQKDKQKNDIVMFSKEYKEDIFCFCLMGKSGP